MKGPWKCRAMENEENQTQVSLRFPPPLEIAARFPQFHRPDDDALSQKKGPQPRIASLPPSGSSFDEKMLRSQCEVSLVCEMSG